MIAEAQGEQEIIFLVEADTVFLVMEFMREAHEIRAFEFQHVRLVARRHIANECHHIIARSRARRAEIVIVRIAERVARHMIGMQKPQTRIVQTYSPA